MATLGDLVVRRTSWRTRLIRNTWGAPFPYLLHTWEIVSPDGSFYASGRGRHVLRWLAEWSELDDGKTDSVPAKLSAGWQEPLRWPAERGPELTDAETITQQWLRADDAGWRT